MTESEPTINSSKLLRRFASDGSEESFARLMREHLDHVYSVAVRRVGGDSHLARDVTQTVFADLVRKLRNRGSDPFGSTPLSGWLHQHTCFVSSKLIRTEQRRRNREEIAAMNRMNEDRTDWSQLAPVIDEAVVQLPESDRIAVLLRFYERRDLRGTRTTARHLGGRRPKAGVEGARPPSGHSLESWHHLHRGSPERGSGPPSRCRGTGRAAGLRLFGCPRGSRPARGGDLCFHVDGVR